MGFAGGTADVDLQVVSGHSSNIISNNLLVLRKIKIDCGEAMVTAALVNMEELLREFPKLQSEDIEELYRRAAAGGSIAESRSYQN